jgi:hypothetical protein
VSAETIYLFQHYDTTGKCAREVVDRCGDLARAIDHCVWHIWCRSGSAQHHHGFWTDVQTVQWVMTAYLIARVIPMPAMGWLIGQFGQRTLFARP